MSPSALINVYCSLIRPCFDYASVVYHSMLTASQLEILERQQKKILRVIYGWELSYQDALVRANIERLNLRRQGFVERFVLRLSKNPRFLDWLPQNDSGTYELRRSQKYQELPFRTERLRCAPLYSFRRVLNFLEAENAR